MKPSKKDLIIDLCSTCHYIGYTVYKCVIPVDPHRTYYIIHVCIYDILYLKYIDIKILNF